MSTTVSDRVEVRVPPPLFFLVPLVTGIGLQAVLPLRFLPGGWLQLAIGVSMVVIGLAFSLTAVRTLARAKTDVIFTRSTSQVIRYGPYGISRNPIYVGGTVMFLGAAVAFNSLWVLGLAPVAVALILVGAIRPEERFLEQRFGHEYLEYKANVRRWL